MSVLVTFLLAITSTLAAATLGDLVSEEVRSRLDRLPLLIVRLAVRRLPAELRGEQAAEWTAELHCILTGAKGLPVTRLARGIRFALGLLRSSRAIGRELSRSTGEHREAVEPPKPEHPAPTPVPAEAGPPVLSAGDLAMLAFESRQWKYPGTKEQAIRDRFGISATRYYQMLNVLIDNPAAEQAKPALVKRLRRIRNTRVAARGRP